MIIQSGVIFLTLIACLFPAQSFAISIPAVLSGCLRVTMTEIRLPFVVYPDDGIAFADPSLTKQSFAEECDFNAVMGRWERTGTIEHVNPAAPQFADVSAMPDYQAALNTIVAANAALMLFRPGCASVSVMIRPSLLRSSNTRVIAMRL